MSFEEFEVGMRVEAVSDFTIEEMLPSPGPGRTFEVQTGDTGEVAQKLTAGTSQWLRVRWDRLRRTLNLDRDHIPMVRPVS